MSRFDKYREVPSVERVSKFDKYRDEVPAEQSIISTDNKEAWGELIAKSLASGVISLADLPQFIGSLLEKSSSNLLAGDMYDDTPDDAPTNFISSLKPASEYIKENLPIDLNYKTKTALGDIVKQGAEFAGGSIVPIGRLNSLGQLGKQIATGAAVGATSGTAQKLGVNPLVADIISAYTVPYGIGATKNTASRFLTKEGRQQAYDRKLQDILKEDIGKDDLSQSIERLDPKNYSHLSTRPTTAEIAQSPGLAHRQRSMAPNFPEFAEREAFNDAILRNELAQVAPVDLKSDIFGDIVQKELDKILQSRKQVRSDVAKPLYAEADALRYGVDLPDTYKYLEDTAKFAKGDIKKSIPNIIDLLSSNSQPKNVVDKIMKEYGNLNPTSQKQLLNQIKEKPLPVEVRGAITQISKDIKTAKREGNDALSQHLSKVRDKVLAETAHIPQEAIAREAWATHTIPVNEIKKNELLSKIIKKEPFDKEFKLSPEKIQDLILNASLKDTKTLNKVLDTIPEFKNTVKSSLLNTIVDKLENTGMNAAGEHKFSYAKIKKLMDDNAKLKTLFDPNEIKVLDNIKDTLERRNYVATAGRAIGSNTQSETTLLNKLAKTSGSLFNKIGREVAAYVVPGGGVAYDATKNILGDIGKRKLDNSLAEAVLNPERGRSILLTEPRQKTPFINNTFLPAVMSRETNR